MSQKTRSTNLGNPEVVTVCGYCGTPCKRKYCDADCWHAKQRTQPAEARFWAHVNKTDGCWLWTGATWGGRRGSTYGQFSVGYFGQRQGISAHVFAYQLTAGQNVPNGFEVMHKCHQPLCVRPDHLELGTHAENVRQSVAAGHYRVPRPRRQKLSAEQVQELRSLAASGEKQIRLAERFGISETSVSFLLRGLRRQYDAPLRPTVEQAS